MQNTQQSSSIWANWRHFSTFSLLIGVCFFALSLTPSLIPRHFILQGILGGLVMALGYMLGQFVLWLWRFMQLPQIPRGKLRLLIQSVLFLLAAALAVYFLYRSTGWQNAMREHVGMPPVEAFNPWLIALIAAVTFIVLVLIGWLVQLFFNGVRRVMYHIMPERTANILGFATALVLLLLFTNETAIRAFFDFADRSYGKASALFDPDVPQPTAEQKTGSPASMVDWDEMGRWGRDFVATGPDAVAISDFTGRKAKDPIRVYVGLESADTAEARAELAYQEMLRTGAFEREVLVVAIPVGSGWLDRGSHTPLEYMHNGDIATVGVQYSYLTSWISIAFEARTGLDQAVALFDKVYAHWTNMPKDKRPKLYMHGLSQGSWASMYSFNYFKMASDPVDGALWVGPPFISTLWNDLTNQRNPESLYRLPTVGDGSMVRFTNQSGNLQDFDAPWGSIRLVFLQYGSDPVVFYEPQSLYREPLWMKEEPAPDVSPELQWYPVVTMMQLALDLAMALNVPEGYGHYYIANDYIDAWVAVTDPPNWSEEDTKRLQAKFADFEGW